MSAPRPHTINHAVVAAASILGGMAVLADKLGVKGPTAYGWRAGLRPVPPRRAIQIQKLTGRKVLAEQLNPYFDFEELRD
jgi:DNA-binding transcriptional regulator YdaS (Cro superfamily)